MAQAYSNDRAPPDHRLGEARRDALRKRFEQLIMLPIGVGTIAAFAILGVRDAAGLSGAPAWMGDRLQIVAILFAAGAFGFSLLRRLRP